MISLILPSFWPPALRPVILIGAPSPTKAVRTSKPAVFPASARLELETGGLSGERPARTPTG